MIGLQVSPKIWVCAVVCRISIPGASSLKDRRQVTRSLIEKTRARYDASCADLGPDGFWDIADLAVMCIVSSSTEAEERASKICGFINRMEDSLDYETAELSSEVFEYGDIQNRQTK